LEWSKPIWVLKSQIENGARNGVMTSFEMLFKIIEKKIETMSPGLQPLPSQMYEEVHEPKAITPKPSSTLAVPPSPVLTSNYHPSFLHEKTVSLSDLMFGALLLGTLFNVILVWILMRRVDQLETALRIASQ
jgi:hypothetical protein